MFIITTTQASHLIKKIKHEKNFHLIYPGLNRDKKRFFLDGEVYVKIPESSDLKNKEVVVLHSGAPKPNEGLQELELILQILRDCNANPISVLFSYFPYGMQDSIFDKGETNVAENIVDKLVSYYGVKKIYIIDAHFCGRKWAMKYPIFHISALPLLIKEAENQYGEILFVSPDMGSKRRTGIPGFKKRRINSKNINICSLGISKNKLKGKTVAIVDDVIQTGGTLLKIHHECKKLKAKNIIALISHGLLNCGINKVEEKYSNLYLSNTINRNNSNVDISPLLIEILLKNKKK